MTASSFNLADKVDPGPNRVWYIEHRPTATKPLRLELREKVASGPARVAFTTIVGRIDTIADELALTAAAEDLMVRAAKSDQFVGIHEKSNGRAEA